MQNVVLQACERRPLKKLRLAHCVRAVRPQQGDNALEDAESGPPRSAKGTASSGASDSQRIKDLEKEMAKLRETNAKLKESDKEAEIDVCKDELATLRRESEALRPMLGTEGLAGDKQQRIQELLAKVDV